MVKENRSVYLKDLGSDPMAQQSEVVVKLGIKSVAGTPLRYEGRVVGALTVGSITSKTIDSCDRLLIGYMANQITTAIVKAQLYEAEREARMKLNTVYLETIESLVKAVEAKDEYTCGHSEEVAAIAKSLALAVGMSEEKADQIYVAGLLHDVGKIGIPSSILCKPSRLTQAEYDEIKLHTIKGYQILKPIGGFKHLAEAALQHHERFDGAGYPDGLSGEDILVEARILAVADAFQAMTSDRPYRKGLLCDEAIVEIEKGMGSQFDPEIAKVLISMLEKGELGKTRCENIKNKQAG